MCLKHTKWLVVLAMLVAVGVAAPVQAAVYTIDYDTEYSGGADPTEEAPWLRATFDDDAGLAAGHVKLTFEALALASTEFVSTLRFNLDPDLDPSLLSIVIIGGSQVGAFADPTVSISEDGFNGAGGANGFDIDIAFVTSNSGGGVNRFTDGDALMFDISYAGVGTFNAFSFDFGAPSGGNAGVVTGAHVQGIATAPGSGWVTGDTPPEIPGVPTPAALPAGLALLGLATLRRRRHA